MIKDLNMLPQMLASGMMTKEEGAKELASYICKNFKIFGLQKYDEDFRNDLLVSILEKGEDIFSCYKPENGDFFSFFYCYVKGKIKLIQKRKAKFVVDEKFSIQEAINHYDINCSKYNETSDNIYPRVPFKYKKVTAEQLSEGIKKYKLERYDRSVFFLAIKASYDLSDNQIEKVARIYDIDLEFLYELIQYLRENLQEKKERRNESLERRNFKYYKHRKYTEEIEYLNKSQDENWKIKRLVLERKDSVQVHDLNNSNQKFEDGFIYLRPTTKMLAKLCNISERQINYYMNCIRNNKISKELLKKIKEVDSMENQI